MRHALTAVLAAASLSSAAAQTPAAQNQTPMPAGQAPQPAAAPQSEIGAAIAKDMDGLMTLYRDLHANPELSLQEVNTAAKLAKRLLSVGQRQGRLARPQGLDVRCRR